jgi:hypothetical protein
VILLMVAAFAGGAISFFLLLPHGVLLALLSMPFGGSLLVLITACLLYLRSIRSDEVHSGRRLSDRPPVSNLGP